MCEACKFKDYLLTKTWNLDGCWWLDEWLEDRLKEFLEGIIVEEEQS